MKHHAIKFRKKIENIFLCMTVVSALSLAGCNSSSTRDEDGHSHESEHSHGDDLELSKRQMQTVGIRLGSLSKMTLGEGVRATGEIAVKPQDVAYVAPLVGGVIKKIYVSEGQQVKAGEPLASIENLEGVGLVNDYNEARAAVSLASAELERQQKLAAHGAGVAKNLERARVEYEAALAREQAALTKVKLAGLNPDRASQGASAVISAPISGIVSDISAGIGSMADISQPIMTVTDISGIYALIKIYEKDFTSVKKGDAVELSLTNAEGTLQGMVAEIIPALDPGTRTIDVRVAITGGEKEKAIPGMAVGAFIKTGGAEASVVPEEAVVSMEGRDFIYVLKDTEQHEGETMYVFRTVEVVTGNRLNGLVEVAPLTDLPADAKIVVAKAFYLASMAADHGEHNH